MEECHLSSLSHCNKCETALKDSRVIGHNILYGYSQLVFKCLKKLAYNMPGAGARQKILYGKPINIKEELSLTSTSNIHTIESTVPLFFILCFAK